MSKFKNLKVGDKVWTIQTGYGKVTSINDTINYPILVEGWASYNLDGKFGCRDAHESLYLTDPFENCKQGKWMLVSFDEQTWYKRFVTEEKDGFYVAWDRAQTDEELIYTGTLSNWKYAKELEPDIEITMGQIAEKFGVKINQIIIKK